MKTRDVRGLIYLGAGLGLLVSIFAAAEFFDASLRAICSVNAFFSCAAVDNSGRTTTLGVPDYLWGIGGFVAVFVVAAIAERRARDVRVGYALLVLTSVGVALSGYFLYVELALIHALCLVCATAYLFGVVVWAASISLTVRTRRRLGRDAEDSPPPETSETVES